MRLGGQKRTCPSRPLVRSCPPLAHRSVTHTKPLGTSLLLLLPRRPPPVRHRRVRNYVPRARRRVRRREQQKLDASAWAAAAAAGWTQPGRARAWLWVLARRVGAAWPGHVRRAAARAWRHSGEAGWGGCDGGVEDGAGRRRGGLARGGDTHGETRTRTSSALPLTRPALEAGGTAALAGPAAGGRSSGRRRGGRARGGDAGAHVVALPWTRPALEADGTAALARAEAGGRGSGWRRGGGARGGAAEHGTGWDDGEAEEIGAGRVCLGSRTARARWARILQAAVRPLDFLLYDISDGILEIDLGEESLAVIRGPPVTNDFCHGSPHIIQGEDGALGLAILYCSRIQMWQRSSNCHGVATWVLWKTVEMHNTLGLPPQIGSRRRRMEIIVGYAEADNVLFIYVDANVYMVYLKSMQSKRLYEAWPISSCHPCTSFYTPGDRSNPIQLYVFDTCGLQQSAEESGRHRGRIPMVEARTGRCKGRGAGGRKRVFSNKEVVLFARGGPEAQPLLVDLMKKAENPPPQQINLSKGFKEVLNAAPRPIERGREDPSCHPPAPSSHGPSSPPFGGVAGQSVTGVGVGGDLVLLTWQGTTRDVEANEDAMLDRAW
ncbi:hypothetical protein VPH35_049677 [Triticum aestivum]|uniref:Uncharacterized protein n=1 Tax=Triticum aestivum TaxID=4565 RepID=A0A077RVV2_WHEAT|nr:unnamed protein product [Triticum aestivum]